ncbi:putative cellulose-binding protein [Streptomyces sp. Tu6071]|nr:putative cellulose-binding protein [Streptomyces sp. Tu6071]
MPPPPGSPVVHPVRGGAASARLLSRDTSRDGLVLGGRARRGDGRTGERREHLAHVGELRVDRVAAVGERRQLALGLAADAVGLRVGVRDDVLGLALRRLDRLARAALGVRAELLGLQAELLGAVLDLRETLLGLRLTRGEVALGLLAALGEIRLEVGGGLRGLGAGLLEEGVRLLALRLGVLLRLGPQVAGLALGLLDDPDALVLRLRLALGGVGLGVVAHLLRRGLGQLPVLLGGPAGLLAQVLRLFLGEPQDLLDPGAEARVRRLRVTHLRLGVLRFEVQLLDPLLQGGDAVQGAVTVGDELRDAFVHLSAVVPTPHKLEAVGGSVAHGVPVERDR